MNTGGLDPFLRLALFATAALIAGAIAGVWAFVSWTVALGAFVGGIVGAILVTLEPRASNDVEKQEPDPRDEQTFTVRQRPRREIERDAAQARDDEAEQSRRELAALDLLRRQAAASRRGLLRRLQPAEPVKVRPRGTAKRRAKAKAARKARKRQRG